MAGFAVLRISTKAASAGLSADLGQVAHRGMSADPGVIGRMITRGRLRLRTQEGMSETPRPLSTRVITVAMKLGSLTMRGENPARRHTPITSSKRLGAPIR